MLRKGKALITDRTTIPHMRKPHAFRHTAITESAHTFDTNVFDIGKVAGHRNLSATQGYIYTPDEIVIGEAS